jgi:hypothetical protein
MMNNKQDIYRSITAMGNHIRMPLAKIHGYSTILLMIEQGNAESNTITSEEALQVIIIQSNLIGEYVTDILEAVKQLENDNSNK